MKKYSAEGNGYEEMLVWYALVPFASEYGLRICPGEFGVQSTFIRCCNACDNT